MTAADLAQIREIFREELRKVFSPESSEGYDLEKIAAMPLPERKAFWKAEKSKEGKR